MVTLDLRGAATLTTGGMVVNREQNPYEIPEQNPARSPDEISGEISDEARLAQAAARYDAFYPNAVGWLQLFFTTGGAEVTESQARDAFDVHYQVKAVVVYRSVRSHDHDRDRSPHHAELWLNATVQAYLEAWDGLLKFTFDPNRREGVPWLCARGKQRFIDAIRRLNRQIGHTRTDQHSNDAPPGEQALAHPNDLDGDVLGHGLESLLNPSTVSEVVLRVDTAAMLRDAELTPAETDVWIRRILLDQTAATVAAQLGITPGAVDTRLGRAQTKLRTYLRANGYPGPESR